jgi:hypothetical protein
VQNQSRTGRALLSQSHLCPGDGSTHRVLLQKFALQ